jgi:hypothetical protein
MTAKITAMRKTHCEHDGMYFTRLFMKQRIGSKMIIGRHHPVMQAALDRTMLPPEHPDFISRLIINVPPGYTKTEQAVISYMARGLAVNPRSRFLHMSYSQDLALLNSATTREIVKGLDYQSMWPMQTKEDADSKSIWWTTVGGGVRATAAGGQITGFRAGHMLNTMFTGAMLIDDPNKPDDAHYPLKLENTNNRYSETAASRLAIETVPIILIMQRIAWLDLSGYLLMGGSGEMWHHLNLPVVIDNSNTYPEEYTHGIPIQHGLENGWLWPYKHNEAHEVALKSHRRKYTCQYAQAPKKRDEEQMVWQESDIEKAHGEPFTEPKNRTVVAVDPAASNTKTSDEHGIGVASSHGMDKYTVEADLSRKGTPKNWADTAIYLYETHNADAIVIETNQGGDMAKDTLRNAGFKGNIIGVHASKGKVTRAEPIAALYAQDFVRHVPGLQKLEEEQLDFDPVTGLTNGKSPNRVDWSVWALTELSKKTSFMIS